MKTLAFLGLVTSLLFVVSCQETPGSVASEETNGGQESSSPVPEDKCATIRTDACGADLYRFIIDPKEMPSTQEELDTQCKRLYVGADCADKYLDSCPNVIRKDVAEHFRKSTRLAVEDVCKEGGPLLGQKLVTHGKCLKERLHEGYNCINDFIENCESATYLQPPSQRMQAACCAFLNFDRCFHNHTSSRCGNTAARPARAIVQGFAIFMVDKCLPYLSQPEKCDLSILKGLLPSDARKVKSMLPALVDVVSVTFK